MAQGLEDMDEVVCYVKNQGMGFTIPYTVEGRERDYYPDFIVWVRTGEEITNLVLDVSGMPKKDKQAKASTARDLWIPAVNNQGGFGKWAYIETREPWDAVRAIRKFLGIDTDA